MDQVAGIVHTSVCIVLASLFAFGALGCDIDSATPSCPAGQCCIRNTSAFNDTFCQQGGKVPCDIDSATPSCPAGQCCIRNTSAFNDTFCQQGGKVPCDIDSATPSCPAGQCCIRNTSAFNDTFCQPVGKEGSVCAPYDSKYKCPCGDKFFCEQATNTSIFGVCKPKKVDIPCDLADRTSICPLGMCCVRDEFLFSYTYCRALGGPGSTCVIHPSNFECPCRDGLFCDSNVHSGHVASLFGSCKAFPTSPTPAAADASTTEIIDEYTTEMEQSTDSLTDFPTTAADTNTDNSGPVVIG